MSRVVPSYTILTATAANVTTIVINQNPENPSELTLTGSYKLEASDPNITDIDQRFSSASFVLSGAAKTALVSFITANLVPIINAQEGL